MEINKYYHCEMSKAEEREHLRKFEEGTQVQIGYEYSSLTAGDGRKHEGPFTALAYEDGQLMIGKADHLVFAFINEDVVVNGSELYTEHLPMLVRFKKDLADILGLAWEKEKCCQLLRSACSVKWMCPLSMSAAELLLQWHRQDEKEEIKRLDTFIDDMSIEDYTASIKRSLRISSYHYSEEQALQCMEERSKWINEFYAEHESPWGAAMDIGYYCG